MAIAGMKTRDVPLIMTQIRRFLRNSSRKFSFLFSSFLYLKPDLGLPGSGHCVRWSSRSGGQPLGIAESAIINGVGGFNQHCERILDTREHLEQGDIH
jgi:hypothetical protein